MNTNNNRSIFRSSLLYMLIFGAIVIFVGMFNGNQMAAQMLKGWVVSYCQKLMMNKQNDDFDKRVIASSNNKGEALHLPAPHL